MGPASSRHRHGIRCLSPPREKFGLPIRPHWPLTAGTAVVFPSLLLPLLSLYLSLCTHIYIYKLHCLLYTYTDHQHFALIFEGGGDFPLVWSVMED